MPFSSVIKVVSKSSLTLTNVESQDELILVGLENVLNDVTVTVSNPHFMYVGRPYNKGDTRAWPIGLKSVFWTEGKPGMNEQYFFSRSACSRPRPKVTNTARAYRLQYEIGTFYQNGL